MAGIGSNPSAGGCADLSGIPVPYLPVSGRISPDAGSQTIDPQPWALAMASASGFPDLFFFCPVSQWIIGVSS